MKVLTMLSSLALLLAVTGNSTATAAEATAYAACKMLVNHQPCVLEWRIKGSASDDRIIERWDRDSQSWAVEKKFAKDDDVGNGGYVLKPGKIYRVLSCKRDGTKCLTSNAVWSPKWADPENIPDVVQVQRNGEKVDLSISRDGETKGPAFQVTQYNMYLLIRELTDLHYTAATLPPMLPPQMTTQAPITLEEQVAYNTFDIYENARISLESYRTTGALPEN